MFRLTAAFLFSLLPCLAKPVLEFDPIPDAPYSASATVHPDATLVFTRSYTGSGENLSQQARSALRNLAKDLSSAGLELSQVANLRGYIKSPKGSNMADQMKDWNQAFTDTFADQSSPPTRTTIGVSQLMDTDSLIAIDAILAAEDGAMEFFKPLLSNPNLARLQGEGEKTLCAIAPYSNLLVTSGVLADPIATGGQDYGPVSAQTESTLGKLENTLGRWGIGVGDLAYVRVMLSPETSEDGEEFVDTDGFTEGWQNFWQSKRVDPPPLSLFAAPGFNITGRLIEVEFYAAFPSSTGPFVTLPKTGSEPRAAILREGSEGSFLSSSIAIARDAKKVWFSGATSHDRDSIYGQGVEALLTLEERMQNVGIQFSDTAQLRAYLSYEGAFGSNFGQWNNAYRRFFDHPKLNPGKPVRTAFPIENLPGINIEIEILAAKRD